MSRRLGVRTPWHCFPLESRRHFTTDDVAPMLRPTPVRNEELLHARNITLLSCAEACNSAANLLILCGYVVATQRQGAGLFTLARARSIGTIAWGPRSVKR